MPRDNKVIPLIPPGKVLCFITGVLRKDTPEENVCQRWARTLVEDYGYEKADIGVEVNIKMGRARKRCDLAIFKHGAEHSQKNIVIAIEVKRDDMKPSDVKDGDYQLISYMAASPLCLFGLWVGEELRAYNSLKRPGEWSDEARKHIPYGQFDVVITNPPFGDEVRVDDAHILSQYQLAEWGTENRRSMMPAEQLFIEAAMNFLKLGGIMGMVIPDGILNNPGLVFLRDWLIKCSRIIASIDLPKETFGRNKGVNNPPAPPILSAPRH